MLQIKEINDVMQYFSAKVLIEFKLVGGALDKDLIRTKEGSEEYIVDVPPDTLRPSALWYLRQFEIANATEYRVLDEKIIKAKDDLLLFYRVDGEFLNEMKLQDFPFDDQKLKMTLVINCSTTGVFPVEVVSPKEEPVFLLTEQAFALGNMWYLDKSLEWTPAIYKHEEGPTAKTFACVHMTVNVSRRPGFYLINIVLPMFCVVPLAALAFAIPRDQIGNRLECTLTVLLSTTAYKYAIAQMIPKVAYSTLLDRYVLGVMGFVALVCLDSINPLGWLQSFLWGYSMKLIGWKPPFDLSETLVVMAWVIHHTLMFLEARAAEEKQSKTLSRSRRAAWGATIAMAKANKDVAGGGGGSALWKKSLV